MYGIPLGTTTTTVSHIKSIANVIRGKYIRKLVIARDMFAIVNTFQGDIDCSAE